MMLFARPSAARRATARGARCALLAMALVPPALVPPALVPAAFARPQVPAETREQKYSANLPACHDQAVLDRITSRFAQRDSNYWSSGLRIVGFNDIRLVAHRPNGLDLIPRRYCKATAAMNDGQDRAIIFSIGEGTGMIGWSWGVEWCVRGLDYNMAYAPHCRAARP